MAAGAVTNTNHFNILPKTEAKNHRDTLPHNKSIATLAIAHS
jgi:hypothetical protein